MKGKYSQESQDFPENFDEDLNENSLVAFLKQNKPIAPSPAPDFERQLFAEISKYPMRSSKFQLKRWLPLALVIPAAIATGLTFNWATNRSLYQMANNSSVNQISETDQAAIEQSLFSSWNVTNDAVLQTTNNSTDTQLLVELAPLEYE
jgi:hypothetical protein